MTGCKGKDPHGQGVNGQVKGLGGNLDQTNFFPVMKQRVPFQVHGDDFFLDRRFTACSKSGAVSINWCGILRSFIPSVGLLNF